MDGAVAFHDNHAVGRDLELLGFLRTAIDIEVDLVTRAYDIALGGRDVHRGFEREVLLVEDIYLSGYQGGSLGVDTLGTVGLTEAGSSGILTQASS